MRPIRRERRDGGSPRVPIDVDIVYAIGDASRDGRNIVMEVEGSSLAWTP
jgi:hypothetical protein